MGVSVNLLLLFGCQITFVRLQMTMPFTSLACKSPPTNLGPLSISFAVNKSPELLTSINCKEEISPIESDDTKKTSKEDPPCLHEVQQRIKTMEHKCIEKKSKLPSPLTPTGLTTMPNLQENQEFLTIPSLELTSQVSSVPLIKLADLNDSPSQPPILIPAIKLPTLNSIPVSKDVNTLNFDSPMCMKIPSNTFVINNNIKDNSKITSDRITDVRDFVSVFTVTDPLLDSKTLKPTKTMKSNKRQFLQNCLSEDNKAKEEILNSICFPKNINENLVLIQPNSLPSAVVKTSKIDTPNLNNNILYPTTNLLYDSIPNTGLVRTENPQPDNKNIQVLFPLETANKNTCPNNQRDWFQIPIVNKGSNTATTAESNLIPFDFTDGNNCINSIQSLLIPTTTVTPQQNIQPLPAAPFPPLTFYSENQPRETELTVSTQPTNPADVSPSTPSTCIEPVTVPPTLKVYKTCSDQNTEHLSSYLSNVAKVLTKNVLSSFLDKPPSNKSMEKSVLPIINSRELPSNVNSEEPISLSMPVFVLSPPSAEYPAPGPKLDVLHNDIASSIQISDVSTEKVCLSPNPYISSITINVMPSVDTASNIIIVV